MPDVNYVVDDFKDNQVVVRWPNMVNGATGQPFTLPGNYPMPLAMSVQLTGTLGAGGNMQFQGSNLITPTWVALKDLDGVQLDMAALGLKGVREMAYQFRPTITAGDGTTSLSVSLTLWR